MGSGVSSAVGGFLAPLSPRSARPTLQSIEETGVNRRPKNKNIFQAGAVDIEQDIEHLLRDQAPNNMDPATEEVLRIALSGFFFNDQSETKMELYFRSMHRELKSAGATIIEEGEPGDKLYVVQEGKLEVKIAGQYIRQMEEGAMFGELALLYDAPRSATVTCLTDCVMWSLSRDLFKSIQALSASAVLLQRSRWLINAPELAVLTPIDLSRLVGTLKTQLYDVDDLIFKNTELSRKCALIEKGSASILVPEDISHLDPASLDKALGIIRPPGGRRGTVTNMNRAELSSFMLQAATNVGFEALDADKSMHYLTEKPTITISMSGESRVLRKVCEVYEGCILGIEVLRSKAGMPNAVWKWLETSQSSGAILPFTVQAITDVECLFFTVDVFEKLFGDTERVLKGGSTYRSKADSSRGAVSSLDGLELDSSMFQMLYVLGSGSFGTVVSAEFINGGDSAQPQLYALKFLVKSVVVKTGQMRHVLDEKKLLASLNNPFVLKFHGSFQTRDELVLVSEALEGGDLWTIIYETPPYNRRKGLPYEVVTFYACSIILGLNHIHENGICFRDLKPENIMTDSLGYTRIIDFGFAKRVPFNKTDPLTGELKLQVKTYTLCGTPEYLAPEFIFNLGHDQSADLWSFGVLLHEMLMGITPFTPSQPNDVTQLFTNIALVQKRGLSLTNRIDLIEGGALSRNLLSSVLKATPSERLGVQEGSTSAILEHPFFASVNIPMIKAKKVPAPVVPNPADPGVRKPLSSMKPSKPYEGDQSIFADF